MAHMSNALLTLFNIFMLVLSIPIISLGVLFARNGSSSCDHFLDMPLIVVGALLLFVSVAGIAGACCRANFLLGFYLGASCIGFFLLLCFAIFELVVMSSHDYGQKVVGAEFREYRLDSYSIGMYKWMAGGKRWGDIRNCLVEFKVCGHLEKKKNETLEDFLKENLSPLESGCCKPPILCGFKYQNHTNWTGASTEISAHNKDCSCWNNDESKLCFDCDSCKAGFIASFQMKWYKAALANVFVLVILVSVYSMGVSALKNNRRSSPYS